MAASWLTVAGVVRAATALRTSGPASLPAAFLANSRERLAAISTWLLARRDEITHPDPERAVGIALYFTLQPLQLALLEIAASDQSNVESAQVVTEASG